MAGCSAPEAESSKGVEPEVKTGAPAGEARAADTKSTDTKSPDTKSSDTKSADTKAPDPNTKTNVAAPAKPGTLHVAAERIGPIDLITSGPTPITLLEGEPVRWVGGAPVRTPGAGLGLERREWLATFAPRFSFFGDAARAGQAWLSSVQDNDRTGPDYVTYERVAEGWRVLDLVEGPIEAHYSAFIERGGASFALQTWASDLAQEVFEMGDDGPEAKAYRTSVDRALARAKPRWVRLAGAEVEPPSMPEDVFPIAAVTTEDGAVHALAEGRGFGGPQSVVVWPQGSGTATVVPLPGIERGGWSFEPPRMLRSGGWALVVGSRTAEDDDPDQLTRYLARGRGSDWERIVVDPPVRDSSRLGHVVGAAITPEGELWVGLGEVFSIPTPGEPMIWRRPADGAWTPVSLPKIAAPSGPARWVHGAVSDDGRWFEVGPGPARLETAHPDRLVWADGGIWIAVSQRGAYAGDDIRVERSWLLTTTPVAGSVAMLPSVPDVDLERYNASASTPGLQPGAVGCEQPSLLLSLPSTPEARASLAAKILAADSESMVRQVYVGTIDGAERLAAMAQVFGSNKGSALTALRDRAAELSGYPVEIDCRIPALGTMVQQR